MLPIAWQRVDQAQPMAGLQLQTVPQDAGHHARWRRHLWHRVWQNHLGILAKEQRTLEGRTNRAKQKDVTDVTGVADVT